MKICIDPSVYNILTSASILLWSHSYLMPQQIISELQPKCLTMLGPLLRIQKVLFVEAVKTVLPTVKISKTSIKFLEYPVSITIPKKRHSLKNGHCYRKRQGVFSALKHERNRANFKALSVKVFTQR